MDDPQSKTLAQEDVPLARSRSAERDTLTTFHDQTHSSDPDTEYEDALDSDTASVSSESSAALSVATTAVGPDAVEAIFHRMIDFGSLRYLWPQLVALHHGSRRRCLLTIGRLLKSYSEDLGHLATSVHLGEAQGVICLSACRFVRRSRFDLAQRIWEAHYHNSESDRSGMVDIHDLSQHLRNFGKQEDAEEDQVNSDSTFEYEVAERFLFDTAAIEALEISIKGYVASNVETKGGFDQGLRAFRRLSNHFWNFSLMFKPSAAQGTHRISWKCVSISPLLLLAPPSSLRTYFTYFYFNFTSV